MREFFRGWKRKVGVVALVVACAVTAIWLRSWTDHDMVTFSFRGCGHAVDSGYGRLHWLSRWFPNGQDISFLYRFDRQSSKITGPRVELGDSLLEKLGFYLNRDGHIGYFEMMLPYWPISLSLIAISAYLCISKPRVAKSHVTVPDQPTL